MRGYRRRFRSCPDMRLSDFFPPTSRLQDLPGYEQQLSSHVTATSTARDSGSMGLRVIWHARPSLYGLLCDFCSSVQEFARQRFFSTDIRLPSDSTSRWTPLPSANASYCRARSGLSPLSCCSCRAHHKSGQGSRKLPGWEPVNPVRFLRGAFYFTMKS